MKAHHFFIDHKIISIFASRALIVCADNNAAREIKDHNHATNTCGDECPDVNKYEKSHYSSISISKDSTAHQTYSENSYSFFHNEYS